MFRNSSTLEQPSPVTMTTPLKSKKNRNCQECNGSPDKHLERRKHLAENQEETAELNGVFHQPATGQNVGSRKPQTSRKLKVLNFGATEDYSALAALRRSQMKK